ncbi:hypothetical protein E5D57_001645 [Metarhizium anisopliae]|nr:hypothetical protein E5D57_013806 [Metarhizium anisopliae]KAF5137866.1 hypothetical protein E5D57_001645 [Metarhizium anisopliae]
MGTERTGLVACILESIQTTTALTTRTQFLSTFTETAKTIFTSTSTSFVPENTLLTGDKTTPPYIRTSGDVTGGSTSAKSGRAVVTTQEIDNRTPGQGADTTTDTGTITGTTTGTTSNTRDTGHTTRATANHETVEPTTPAPIQPTATATANTNDKQQMPPATPAVSNDGAFAGSATRVMPPPLTTSVTTTLITTMTVTGTVAAICGSTTKQV